MANEMQKITTSISQWTNSITNLVIADYKECGVDFDEYSTKCAMSAMNAIYNLVNTSDKLSFETLNRSNLRDVVEQCAALKLNANSNPKECYFSIVSDYNKKTKKTTYRIAMGIEGDGYDKLLINFGNEVKRVYPCWIVKEGDDFTFPRQIGIETQPPTWQEKGISQKCIRVVYPVMLNDGSVMYLMAERESVKNNLLAHIRQNLRGETFGICENEYYANEEQKAQIKAKKEEIYDLLRACETVDDMLKIDIVKPYISGAWLDTGESMIRRKMRNNAIRNFTKNYDAMANKALGELDETYKEVSAEISENANVVEFDDADIVDAETVEVVDGGNDEA